MKMSQRSKQIWSRIALFTAAVIWGSSFFVMKNSLDGIGPNYLNAIRNTIGFVLLSLVFAKRLKKVRRQDVLHGAITGACVFLGSILQTAGLLTTMPGKNAFLTAVYCVIVPFLYWIVYKLRPDRFNFSAAVLCIIGIGLVSLTSSFTMEPGDALVLAGGFFFAAHVVAVGMFTRDGDPILLAIFQFGFSGLYSWIAGLFTESFPSAFAADTIFGLLYLAVMATSVGMLLQCVGQKYTNPNGAAIIMSLESVFGVLFSVLFYGEILTPRLVLGFLLIFIAILISETKLSFLPWFKRPASGTTDLPPVKAEKRN